MAGFNSPTILHLSTWDAPERKYMSGVLQRLREAGYERYHEPAVGGFAMPLVAAEAGWKPSEMDTSDVFLYSAILGELVAGRDMTGLKAAVDGKLVRYDTEVPLEQAAYLLYVQYLTRMQVKPSARYWEQLTADLTENDEQHIGPFREQLRSLWARLDGIQYRSEDVWSHLERVADDPQAVIVSNPPTYAGAYEKHFDTKDRLTWDGPEYEVFDAPRDIPRMVEFMEGREALLIVQQQQTTRNSAHAHPIYARQLSPGQLVYLNSNRPDEVNELIGGPHVVRRKMPPRPKRPWPVLPVDYDLQPDARVEVVKTEAQVADVYRTEWMHRLYPTPASGNVMILIDGYAAGVIGYSLDTILNRYSDKWAGHAMLRFAFGAKHEHLRLTRLATMLSLQHSTLWEVASPLNSIAIGAAQGLVTVEMTRHPEAKGLRQLMKLHDRQSHPDGYKLVYAADWAEPGDPSTVLTRFLNGEQQWQKNRRG